MICQLVSAMFLQLSIVQRTAGIKADATVCANTFAQRRSRPLTKVIRWPCPELRPAARNAGYEAGVSAGHAWLRSAISKSHPAFHTGAFRHAFERRSSREEDSDQSFGPILMTRSERDRPSFRRSAW